MNGNLSGKTTPKERVEFILFIGKNYYRVCLSVGCLLSTFLINYHWLVVDSLCPFARKGILRCFKISLKLDLQCTLLLCKFLQIKTATTKKKNPRQCFCNCSAPYFHIYFQLSQRQIQSLKLHLPSAKTLPEYGLV